MLRVGMRVSLPSHPIVIGKACQHPFRLRARRLDIVGSAKGLAKKRQFLARNWQKLKGIRVPSLIRGRKLCELRTFFKVGQGADV
jgi:hypothetical protein